jgi:tRNA (guanine6-N2)-methyltransferase
MRFIAYTVKGLEHIAADEISRLIDDAQIIESAPKRVIFEAPMTSGLAQLKTADDIGILLGQTKAVNLDDIAAFVQELDVSSARTAIEQIRPELANTFSITTTIAGARGFTGDELNQAISEIIKRKTGWKFTELDHSNFDVRIFVDRSEVYCSVKLLAQSLHERAYKTVSRQGSLRATIAAAMATIATQGKSGLKVVDNFCGSGTILAEALLAGHEIYGGDIEPESVEFTRRNLVNLKYDKPDRIVQLNATKTKWPSNFFDCAISNLPWGKQIEIERITDLYHHTLQEYARILKPQGMLCLLIGSKPELLMKHAKQVFPGANIKTWQLGYLGQTPTIVFVSRR